MAEQDIEVSSLAGIPANITTLGAVLTSTGDGNPIQFDYGSTALVLLQNPTSNNASVKVKVHTDQFQYLDDFGFTLSDRTFSIPAGATFYLTPTVVYSNEEGKIQISSNQRIRIIPIGQWERG